MKMISGVNTASAEVTAGETEINDAAAIRDKMCKIVSIIKKIIASTLLKEIQNAVSNRIPP